MKKALRKVNTLPARRVGVEDSDNDLRALGIVHSVSISTPRVLAFDAVAAGAVAVATVIVSSFGKALLGKAAEATWSLLASRFDRTLPATGKVQVVYRPKDADALWELVVTYPDAAALRRDKKNHRIYLAVAEGCAMRKAPGPRESISLLSAVPSDSKTRPSELFIRRRA